MKIICTISMKANESVSVHLLDNGRVAIGLDEDRSDCSLYMSLHQAAQLAAGIQDAIRKHQEKGIVK